MKTEEIKEGDILLYDDPSTAVMFVKIYLNIQRKRLGLPADTRLYGHTGIIFRQDGKLYQLQTNTQKGRIKTLYKPSTGNQKDRVKILTPMVPLNSFEIKKLNDVCSMFAEVPCKYDWWSFASHLIYMISNNKVWVGKKKTYFTKLNCFESVAYTFNQVREYFKSPWKVTSLDMIYSEKFRQKLV